MLKNAIGVPKHRIQDSVSINEHTVICSFCFDAIFLTELDLKLSSMYLIACFFKGSLKCDLSIQKSFCGYVEVSSDFRQQSGDTFGGIGRTVWDFNSQENQLFE